MTDTRLTDFLEAIVSGNQARAAGLAQQKTREERDQVDQLHAVGQLTRLRIARGQVQ